MSTPVSPTGSRWLRVTTLWIVPLIVGGAGIYLYGKSGRYVSTDNAYLARDRVDVTAQVTGEVREVRVAENASVPAGEPILVLDDAQQKIAVEAAELRVAAAKAQIAVYQAGYVEKSGELELARRTSEYAMREYRRQEDLAGRKLAPASTLDSAHRSADLAVGAIRVLELQRSQLAAQLGGHIDQPLEKYSLVRTAATELERARLDLARTRIAAPVAGIASHLPKVGSRVEAGRAAFAIVSSGQPWVDANFKETDLEWIRPGAQATVVLDSYPGHLWHGRVQSISAATGSEFSLLPAQNASGNWVKVVQRVPVRIELTTRADDPPLRDGMSANVDIDTGAHTHFDRWFGRDR
jgi:membrane fusion protein, multidrug efflux system